jgi:hypothetical protein
LHFNLTFKGTDTHVTNCRIISMNNEAQVKQKVKMWASLVVCNRYVTAFYVVAFDLFIHSEIS